MGRLIIDSGKRDFSLLADALYKELGQTEDLMAETVFMASPRIKRLNKDTRGVDADTDVLSFPALKDIRGKVLTKAEFPIDIDNEGNIFLGSVAICEKRVEEQAKEYGHSFERELNYLLLHGLLHLFGYDHENEEDKTQMRDLEEKIMSGLKLTRENI